MHVAEFPPTPRRLPAPRLFELAPELGEATARLRFALDLLAQCVEQSRHGDDDRDAVAPHGLDDLRGLERVLEKDLAADDLRDKDAHELTEDVAERHEA